MKIRLSFSDWSIKTYMNVVTVHILGIANIVSLARSLNFINCFSSYGSLNIMLFTALGSFTMS